jgi:phosphohistidine swiveling domain-containing protein
MNSKNIVSSDSLVLKEVYGGKAYWLSWLKKNNFNVPPALFLPIDFDIQSIDKRWLAEEINNFFNTNTKINNNIMFAIRSSSIHEDTYFDSHAGQYRSITKIKSIEDAINEISSILYTENESLNSQMGVIIQEYIEASHSGVVFSTHPTRENKNIVLLEYVKGNSEELLEGKLVGSKIEVDLTMDNYKSNMQFEKMMDIVSIAKEIENILSYPVDIEWAICKNTGQLFIVQCRPITNLLLRESKIIKVSTQNINHIPKSVLNNDKVQLRLKCIEKNAPTTEAFLLLINENDYTENYLSDLLNSEIKLKQNVGYSNVLIYPAVFQNKILRKFSNNTFEDLRLQIASILKSCFSEHWHAVIIIQELLDMNYMGIIKKINSSYLIEVAFGGFIQKGVTEASKYIVSESKIEKTEVIQKFMYDVVDGRIERFPINRKIELNDELLLQITSSFESVIEENTVIEFGISRSEQGYYPYLIDIVDDNSSLNVKDVSEGIISKGKVHGTVINLSIESNHDWKTSVQIHFHDISANSDNSNSNNAIYVLERPDIKILEIINSTDCSNIGFLFREASILSHVCVILRENNIPAMILPQNYKDRIEEGSLIAIDTLTNNLPLELRLTHLDNSCSF